MYSHTTSYISYLIAREKILKKMHNMSNIKNYKRWTRYFTTHKKTHLQSVIYMTLSKHEAINNETKPTCLTAKYYGMNNSSSLYT